MTDHRWRVAYSVVDGCAPGSPGRAGRVLPLRASCSGTSIRPRGGSTEPATKAAYVLATSRCSNARLSARCASAFRAKRTTPEASRSIRWTTHSRRRSRLSSRFWRQSERGSPRAAMTGSPAGLATATRSWSSWRRARGGGASDTAGPYRPSRGGANCVLGDRTRSARSGPALGRRSSPGRGSNGMLTLTPAISRTSWSWKTSTRPTSSFVTDGRVEAMRRSPSRAPAPTWERCWPRHARATWSLASADTGEAVRSSPTSRTPRRARRLVA